MEATSAAQTDASHPNAGASGVPPTGYDAHTDFKNSAFGTSASDDKVLALRDQMLAGVAGGVAHYLGANPTLVRLLIVAGTLSAGPVIPILYVVAWIIMPDSREGDAVSSTDTIDS